MYNTVDDSNDMFIKYKKKKNKLVNVYYIPQN